MYGCGKGIGKPNRITIWMSRPITGVKCLLVNSIVYVLTYNGISQVLGTRQRYGYNTVSMFRVAI